MMPTVTAAVADAAAGNGKVSPATPTDMLSLDSRFRGNDGAVVAVTYDTDNDGAAVAGTVATTVDSIGNGAVAIAVTVIDGTVTDTGSVKKQNFHTGLDPVSRTNNSAQPTEFNAGVGVTVTNPDDAIVVTGNAENKIVIPAGSGNPVARTAKQTVALSWTANDGGERSVTPPPAMALTASPAQPTTLSVPPSPRATVATVDTTNTNIN